VSASTLRIDETAPLHVAIIMDGNGRWAQARGWPRTAGHRAGGEAVRRVVEAAPRLGIRILTLYAFSSDNWQRPAHEVATLLQLFRDYLRKQTAKCVEKGIRISVIGRRDRLPLALCSAIENTEAATASGNVLHLRIAVDYSSRDAILRAASHLRETGTVTRENFALLLAEDRRAGAKVADVDLLIRTGGEQRLSDFLLWECAYAELYFTRRMWPDFSFADLKAAVREFQKRERRFGSLPVQAAG
jgi:undecaprenyl diphosphate synthase